MFKKFFYYFLLEFAIRPLDLDLLIIKKRKKILLTGATKISFNE